MLKISSSVAIPEGEIVFNAIRSQGAGGQNVNKVSSAIHLKFDIAASSLPEVYKERLLALRDRRISKEGCILIKAQQFRTQEKNREDAISRLKDLIKSVLVVPKVRRATKPSLASKRKRLDQKTRRGQLKKLRSRLPE